MMMGIVLGRLLGMDLGFPIRWLRIGRKSKNNQAVVLKDLDAPGAQELVESSVVVKPPKRGPGKNDVGSTSSAEPFQLTNGSAIIAGRSPVLAIMLDKG